MLEGVFVSTPGAVTFFTNEYPPHVYGGAGVHVAELTRALSRLLTVEVRCFGDQQLETGPLRVRGYPAWEAVARPADPRFAGAFDALSRTLLMVKDRPLGELVHCHTWYTDLAGVLAKMLWETPLVVTIHSLEPLRPWKAEQLGAAYRVSSWMERTGIEQADAVIAVSAATRADVLRLFAVAPERVQVIHNGIDPTVYHKVEETAALVRYGVDPGRPYVLFVGRMTRQKGLPYLLDAVPYLDPGIQVVICAGKPDTPEIAQEVASKVAALQATRPGVIWIQAMLPREELLQLYSHAAVFCCPSIYEPFGLINLEAMACEVPVVAAAVGGIPEVVVDGETGILVPVTIDPDTLTPVDPDGFARGLAEAINRLVADPTLRRQMGQRGRHRVEEQFSWDAIARQTLALYRQVLAGARR